MSNVDRIKEIAVRYLTEKEVNQITGRALSTLRNDRSQGKGIPYIIMGERSVRYELADIKKYMDDRKVQTSETSSETIDSS